MQFVIESQLLLEFFYSLYLVIRFANASWVDLFETVREQDQ